MLNYRAIGVAAVIVASTVLSAGCSGSEPAAITPNLRVPSDRSSSEGRELIYVASGKEVYVYKPQGKLLGSLGEVAGNLCSDSHGDVFISRDPASSYEVLEYRHGAIAPELTLNVPTYAEGCAVDPVTGNLAVADDGHGVTVFPYSKKFGWRFSKTYNTPNIEASAFCTYDANGNLFVDGTNSKLEFALSELETGGKSLQAITLDQNITKAGPVQWDGKHLAVEDAAKVYTTPVTIYQFDISGSSGTEVGSTTLSDSFAGLGVWIQGNRVIAAYGRHQDAAGLGVWPYPSGGAPVRHFSAYAGSVTVSIGSP